jgi:hypothetical protein
VNDVRKIIIQSEGKIKIADVKPINTSAVKAA